MFIITYIAINNDTYDSKEFTLQHRINPDDEENPLFEIVLKELPRDIEAKVDLTYDGVWEPDLKSIKIFEVKEIVSTNIHTS